MPNPTELVRDARLVVFLTLVVAILFSTTGELFLMLGMKRVGELTFDVTTLVRTFTMPQIIFGFVLFFTGALFWLRVLGSEGTALSWAYPMLALGYPLVVLESRLLLGEPVTAQRWLGTLVILLGVTIMFGSWRR